MYASFKRGRSTCSSEEEGDIKRGRTESINSGTSSLESVFESKSDMADDRMGMTDFDSMVDKIVTRLQKQYDETSKRLQKQYDETTKRMFEGMKEVQKRMNVIEENDSRQDKEIDNMRADLDDIKQKEKDRNMVVTGLKDEQMTKEEAIKTLNDNLKTNIRSDDIEYVLKLKTTDTQPSRLRIVFTEKSTKMKVMKQKTKLKNKMNVWLSDDLTKYKSDIAYAARQALRDNKIHQTWVHDGKIFIKKTTKDRPITIRRKEDLPN
jgi:hypothetical protein